MFKSVKTKLILAAELIMPWLTLIGGIPAIYYWQKSDKEWRIEYNSEAYFHAESMFESFYNIAMIIGWVVIAAEIIISFVSLILMIISIVKKTKCITAKMLGLFVCGNFCALGTGILMFLILAFTYGMGV